MKTPEELAREVMHEAKWAGERYVDEGGAMLARITRAIAEAMADSTAHAIRNVPPLPMLLVSDERAAEIRKEVEEYGKDKWHLLLPIAQSLLRDRETLLRLLCDCDSIDAYVRGYNAGRNTIETFAKEPSP